MVARMVMTPWGDATELRTKKMRPGGGSRDARTEQSQRERLFAAMVATVAEKGYEATTVADVAELSGVSRAATTSTSATSGTASWRRSRRWSGRA